MNVYAMYDRAAELYGQPFYQHNDSTAIRATKNAVNTEGHEVRLNPSDHELWRIAKWNDETGEITMDKQRLARCEELKEINNVQK